MSNVTKTLLILALGGTIVPAEAEGPAAAAHPGTSAGAETFTNPVIAADWPDPAVWKDGDWHYSVATGLRTIRRSRNLIDWEDTRTDPLTPKARARLH